MFLFHSEKLTFYWRCEKRKGWFISHSSVPHLENLKDIFYLGVKKRKVWCGVGTEKVDKHRTPEIRHHSLEGQTAGHCGCKYQDHKTKWLIQGGATISKKQPVRETQASPFPICFLRTTVVRTRPCLFLLPLQKGGWLMRTASLQGTSPQQPFSTWVPERIKTECSKSSM